MADSVPSIDAKLHLERFHPSTIYHAEHCIELGMRCVGLVFRDDKSGDVVIVSERESRRLDESEARRLMIPSA